MEPSCYSINYLFTMSLCVLNNATRAVEPIKFQYRPDVVYIEHLDRPKGSCDGDFPCENRGTCVNIPQYPGYQCICADAYVGEQCEECSSPPVGLSDNRITNNKITGSSTGQWGLTYYYPYMARLNGKSSWVVSLVDYSMYLDIDLAPQLRLITGIATQGNPDKDWWTTKYTINYRLNGDLPWISLNQDFNGNSDRHTVVHHSFVPAFLARYVRVLLLEGHTRTAIRVELYGCNAQ
ncbi:Retinoschisin [Exaiptasia diaphana]|nr:Retinoschisin [Exaiptasia diaphana]